MANYEYSVIDSDNVIHRGNIRCWFKRQANKQLQREGISVVTLARVRVQYSRWRKIFRHISRIDKIIFYRNLMTMMRAGLNLNEALASSREQSANPYMKRVIAEAEKSVLAGQPLSDALNRYPKLFPQAAVAMIRLGEHSGKLIETLSFLVQQQEGDFRMLRKIRNALVYPTLIICTMVGIVIIMMIFVIPKISQIYVDAGAPLPIYTRILVNVSMFLASNGVYVAAALLLLVVCLRAWLSRSKKFRLFVHRLMLRLPIFGEIIKKVNLAMAARSLHMLTKSGVSVDESLVLTSGTVSNLVYQQVFREAVPFVRRGVTISQILKGKPTLFLPLFSKMVMTGEETGNLDDMFSHAAKYYDEDVQHWSTNVSTLIEPIMLLGTAVVVGGVALAIIYPLWNFANIIE
ncbi:MAG: type II secretion system F family protein [Patescibacteria group bacterium]|jgi:type II secretory pathway component PulF